MQKEYRLDLKIRNNLILDRIEKAGYKTAGEFAKKNNIGAGSLGKLINMQQSPVHFTGDYLPLVYKLAALLQCSPDQLFSEKQLHAEIKSNKRTLLVDEAEAKYYLANDVSYLEDPENFTTHEQMKNTVEQCLSALNDRERKIIEMRFYENKTLDEIGGHFGISGNRIRQIECKALRKLRTTPRLAEQLIEHHGRI